MTALNVLCNNASNEELSFGYFTKDAVFSLLMHVLHTDIVRVERLTSHLQFRFKESQRDFLPSPIKQRGHVKVAALLSHSGIAGFERRAVVAQCGE